MTENENIQATFEDAIYCAKSWAGDEVCEECRLYPLCHTFCDDVAEIIVKALEEIQQYRAIGTVEEVQTQITKSTEWLIERDTRLAEYQTIGTIEEFKALKEKNTPRELDEHNFQDEPHHYLCPNCRCIVSYTQNYCEWCGQALET